jgi:hypothetical protein
MLELWVRKASILNLNQKFRSPAYSFEVKGGFVSLFPIPRWDSRCWFEYYKQSDLENLNIIKSYVPDSQRFEDVTSSLNDIYNISDIAIDSLGRHRSNVMYNSTLKGKEYCAKGLPIVSGVKTEFDYDE